MQEKACKNCNECKPLDAFPENVRMKDGHLNVCRSCANAKRREYHSEHRTEENEKHRKWMSEHQEHIAEYSSKWKFEHKLEIAQYNRKWAVQHSGYSKEYYWKNRERIKAYRALHYQSHLERIRKQSVESRLRRVEKARAYHRRYKKLNPDRMVLLENRRRARTFANGGNYTQEEWLELCESFGGRCARCGIVSKLTVDHVVPISKGGVNTIENIQPLCSSCNSRKKDKIEDYRPITGSPR